MHSFALHSAKMSLYSTKTCIFRKNCGKKKYEVWLEKKGPSEVTSSTHKWQTRMSLRIVQRKWRSFCRLWMSASDLLVVTQWKEWLTDVWATVWVRLPNWNEKTAETKRLNWKMQEDNTNSFLEEMDSEILWEIRVILGNKWVIHAWAWKWGMKMVSLTY